MALLAKQVWRIMRYSNFLIAKVLKERYFPHSSILEANFKGNPSYSWRSLCWSRDLFRKGIRWKINNGRTVRITFDPFIAELHWSIPKARARIPIETTVGAFFTNERQWSSESLPRFFDKYVVDAILQVPIGNQHEEDQVVWRFTEDGIFTVKSGYLTKTDYYETHPMMSGGNQKEWNDLVWSLRVPPKVRIFLWRVFHNLIPVGIPLRGKHVHANPRCSKCGKDRATTTHTLFFCEKAEIKWKQSLFWRFLKNRKKAEMIEIGRIILAELGNDNYHTWAMATLMSWSHFCTTAHNPSNTSFKPSLERAQETLQTYSSARKALGVKLYFGIQLGERSCHPPMEGAFRVDVDAGVDKANGLFGVGVVVRDTNGKMVAALAKPFKFFSSALDGETHAVVEGLSVCIKAKASPLFLFSDSILAVKVLTNTDPYSPCLDAEVFSIMKKAKEENFVLGLAHMYKSANRVAHSLASFAKSCNEECLWMSNFPQWLRELAKFDYE